MSVVRTAMLKHADPPLFADRWPHGVEHVPDTPVDLVLLEGGMQSGAPSIMICADLAGDGRGVVIETSWAALHAAHDALAVSVVELAANAPGVDR